MLTDVLGSTSSQHQGTEHQGYGRWPQIRVGARGAGEAGSLGRGPGSGGGVESGGGGGGGASVTR